MAFLGHRELPVLPMLMLTPVNSWSVLDCFRWYFRLEVVNVISATVGCFRGSKRRWLGAVSSLLRKF